MLLRCLSLLICSTCLCFARTAAKTRTASTQISAFSAFVTSARKTLEPFRALAQYLNDPNRNIRLEAVKAIVKIDTEASLASLSKATHDKDAEIQIRATDGLVNTTSLDMSRKAGLLAL